MDDFYRSKRWQAKRRHILLRDNWIDQVAVRDGVTIEADTVHHILPREDWPQYELADWNLISVNGRLTHKGRLHEKYSGKLTRFGMQLMRETAIANGVRLQSVTLVIGMPGTGKTYWTRKHLQGGLCYDLDAVAAAFRLSAPHKDDHKGARRMAAALRSGWIEQAKRYTNNVFVIRSAPDVEELSEMHPDRIVVMTKQYTVRSYRFDEYLYRKCIREAIEWAEVNGVEVQYIPKSGRDNANTI